VTTAISNNSFNSMLPNVYVQRAELTRVQPDKLEVNLQILLKGIQNGWYKPSSTGTSIRLMMCFITDQDEIRKIYKYPSYLRRMIKRDSFMSGVYKKYISIGEINPFGRIIASKEIINEEKGLYIENLSHNVKAVISDMSYPYLGCLIVPYLGNLQSFSKTGLDSGGIFPTGDLCVEDVLINNNAPTTGKIFTLEETVEGYGTKNDVWVGAVHRNALGKFMAGQAHTATAHPRLASTTYTNKKVLDFRYRTKGLNSWKNLNRRVQNSLKAAERNKNISYFSPMAYSRQRQDSINLFFGIDLVAMAQRLTKYSHLYTNSGDLLNAMRVLDIELYRKRVTREPLSNRLTGIPAKDFYKNYTDTLVCSLSEKTLKNINISNMPSNMYHFTGTDLKMANINDGLYQYKVKVRISDLTHQKISESAETLSAALAAYSHYVSLTNNPAGFDNVINAFKEKYIKILYTSGPAWSDLVNAYIGVVSSFLGTSISEEINLNVARKNMLNMTDPRSATVDSVLRARKIVEDLLSRLNREVRSTPAFVSSEQQRHFQAGMSSSKVKGALIEREHYFLSAYSARDRNNIGLDYFEDIADNPFRLLKMSAEQWRSRMGHEASYYSGKNDTNSGIKVSGYITPQIIKTPVGIIKVQKEMDFDISLPILAAKMNPAGRLTFDRAYSAGVEGQSIKGELLGQKGITIVVLYQGVGDFMQKSRNSSPTVEAKNILGKGSKFDTEGEDCDDTKEIELKGAPDKDAEIKNSPLAIAVLDNIAKNLTTPGLTDLGGIANSFVVRELSTKTDLASSNIFQFNMNYNSSRVVEYLVGYTRGVGLAAGPIWKQLTDAAVSDIEASKGSLVCRMRTINSITGGENIYKLDPYNEIFIIGNLKYSFSVGGVAGPVRQNNAILGSMQSNTSNQYLSDLPIEYLNSHSVSLNRATLSTSQTQATISMATPSGIGTGTRTPPTPGGSSGMGGY